MSDVAPPGFEVFTRPSPLMDPWRPIFSKEEADRLILGVRLREAHTNSRGTAHGGFIAALADQAMGMSCGVKLRVEGLAVANLWTVSLNIDYLGSAKVGEWLTFDTIFAHLGKTLCHAEMNITAEGVPIARGRAAFRVMLSKDSAG